MAAAPWLFLLLNRFFCLGLFDQDAPGHGQPELTATRSGKRESLISAIVAFGSSVSSRASTPSLPKVSTPTRN